MHRLAVLILTATFLGLHGQPPFPPKFSLKKQPCECAKVKQDKPPEKWKKAHDRIVGGYDTQQNKPWAARIWINPVESLCGGSLINKRYVLTAEHCICKSEAKLNCNKQGVPTSDIKKLFTVYLGVNEKKVDFYNSQIKGDKYFEYGVEHAQAYRPEKMYKKYDQQFHDIGLLKLDRDAKIVPNVLQPICLPLKFDKSQDTVSEQDFDAGKALEVYVSGWGRLFQACVTNKMGPVKGLKCKPVFMYKGSEQKGCSRTRTPSAKDKDCKDFYKQNKKDYPKNPGDSVRIIGGKTNQTCYAKQGTEHGWCMTETQNNQRDPNANWGWYVPLTRACFLYFCV